MDIFASRPMKLLFSMLILCLSLNSFSSDLIAEKKRSRNRVIGTVADFMPRTGNNIGPGTLAADAILSQTEYTGVQVSLISNLEIRSDLIPGPITINTIRKLALDSKIITFELQVHELKQLIEHMILWQSRRSIEFARLHVSGIRFSLDINAQPDQMITDIDIGSISSGYRFSDSTEIVRIASTAYVLNDLAAIKGKQFLWNVTPAHITLHKVIEQHIYSLTEPVSCNPENRINTVNARIKIFSDPHYFDPALLISDGAAFKAHCAQSTGLAAESRSILLSAVSSIRASRPDICLIPGDLTNNGELLNHSSFNQIITDSLLSADIKVFVTPGNHDLNNRNAYCFDGNTTLPVKTIDNEDFEDLYANCGYGDALAQDPASLSYVAQLQNGLWVLSIDGCTFASTHSEEALSDNTLQWIIERLDYARKYNIRVIGLMHHSITEHFTGQSQIASKLIHDETTNDFTMLMETLASHGLRILFTGHNHVQEIVKYTGQNGNFLFDVSTGSLSSWPSPLRTVTLTPFDQMEISSSFINHIDYQLPVPEFQHYTKETMKNYFTTFTSHILSSRFSLDLQQQQILMPSILQALMAHVAGDESPSAEDKMVFKNLMSDPDPVITSIGTALQSLWTDLAPSDNACSIDLIGGSSW